MGSVEEFPIKGDVLSCLYGVSVVMEVPQWLFRGIPENKMDDLGVPP